MTPVERTEAIKDLAAANLPALLGTAGLDDFDAYRNKTPLKSDDKEFCVYIDIDDDDTDSQAFGAIIQVQLSGKDEADEYHSVIMPFLRAELTASVVDYTVRESIKSDIWPMDNKGVSFIYYFVTFTIENDDCDL